MNQTLCSRLYLPFLLTFSLFLDILSLVSISISIYAPGGCGDLCVASSFVLCLMFSKENKTKKSRKYINKKSQLSVQTKTNQRSNYSKPAFSCSKLTIETLEHIFLLLTLNM